MQQNLDFRSQKANKLTLYCFLNELGFIPHKNETEVLFFARVSAAFPGGQQQIEILSEQTKEVTHPTILKALHLNTRYMPWVISSRGLRPWHLGVFETDGIQHKIQIHPRAKRLKKLTEVLSHEAIHYLRRDLNTPYEELLCYLASQKMLYKHLGFFLVSPEFKITLGCSLLGSLLITWVDVSLGLGLLMQASSPLLFVFGFLFCRYRQRAVFQLINQFRKQCINSPLLFRLDADEIKALSIERNAAATIKEWSQRSFRWKFLSLLYLD